MSYKGALIQTKDWEATITDFITTSPKQTLKTILVLDNISKAYKSGADSVHALRSVNLQVAPGEFVAVVGPSGSGKSTLLSITAGLDHPTEGRVLMDNVCLTELNETQLALWRSQRIGFIFQSFNLISSMTVLENVELPARFMPKPPPKLRERAKELLELVGMSDRLNHLPSELSGGQQQRVAIARSLINRPALVLADEPTGNLDSANGAKVVELLKATRERENCSLLVATHDPAVAAEADRVVVLRDGLVTSGEVSR